MELALQVKVGKVASFVGKIFVVRLPTTKTTNILPHENYTLYGIIIAIKHNNLHANIHYPANRGSSVEVHYQLETRTKFAPCIETSNFSFTLGNFTRIDANNLLSMATHLAGFISRHMSTAKAL